MEKILVNTSKREEFVDITAAIARLIEDKGWRDGVVMIFCPHTTCGLTINEGADPDVKRDLLSFLHDLAPQNGPWLHAEGNSDAHIKASLLGSSQLVPVEEGQLCLGTWQHIYLYEGDGPRRRYVWLKLLK